MIKNVVVIAPHPDDETLGCGGTLLKHKQAGDNVICIFVTGISELNGYSKSTVDKRKQEIEDVKRAYDFNEAYELNYTPSSLTQNDIPSLIGKFSAIFKEFKPTTVYLPFMADVHSDHRVIFEAIQACTKTFRYPFITEIMMYETVSETDYSLTTKFNPNYFVDITDFIAKKIKIFKIYESEVQEFSMPRSVDNIEALAKYRGASIAKKYAESFQILKMIN